MDLYFCYRTSAELAEIPESHTFIQLSTLAIISVFVLSTSSLLITYWTPAGPITPTMISTLTSTLLTKNQVAKLQLLFDDKDKHRTSLLKFLNQSLLKHALRQSDPRTPIQDDDIELLDLSPTPSSEQLDREREQLRKLPDFCKFFFCTLCQQVMPPRSDHCEACD
jgi:hypothetical protein